MAFVFLLCEDQANDLRVDADAFEERLYGDNASGEPVSDCASYALLESLIDFFQKLRQTALAKLTEAQIQAMRRASEELEKLSADGNLDSLLSEETDALIERLLGIIGDRSQS